MKRWLVIILVVLSTGAALLWWQLRPRYLTVDFFDVGQGDAELIRTPQGQTILIDGGPDKKILEKLGTALPWADRSLDLVVLSHPHADHVSGLIEVLQRYRVRRILATGVVHTTPEYIKWLELIKNKKIPLTVAQAGQRIEFSGGVVLEILWPLDSYAGQQVGDLNATSIVARLSYGPSSALFTGDTPRENEQLLLNSGANLKAQLLKVAHQGSRTSSSEEFIRAVAPRVAIIPVGRDNRFGHPHAEVVERLKNLVSQVLRTDRDGDIRFASNGVVWRRLPLRNSFGMLP